MSWKVFGSRAKRLEDPALLRGQARFIDDIRLPETLQPEETVVVEMAFQMGTGRSWTASLAVSGAEKCNGLSGPGQVAP